MTLVNKQTIDKFVLWRETEGKRIPYDFSIEITERCNNHCRHCYINKDSNDKAALEKEMPLSQIVDIAEEAVSLGTLWCLLTGGEPLLRRDFVDIFIHLKKLGLLVNIFSNAATLTPDHMRLFKSYPPRSIEISVYGVSKATYEHITQTPGSYAKYLKGLQLLEDNKIKYHLKTVIMRSNYHEASAIIKYCRERSKELVRYDPFLCLRYDNDKKNNAIIKRERLSAEEIVALEKRDSGRRAEIKKICEGAKTRSGVGTRVIRCAAGVDSFAISAAGKYQLCQTLKHPATVYNLKKGRLKYAWEVFTPKVRSISSPKGRYLQSCACCLIVNICHCCPAIAYLEEGEMDTAIGYFCDIAHARAMRFGDRKLTQNLIQPKK